MTRLRSLGVLGTFLTTTTLASPKATTNRIAVSASTETVAKKFDVGDSRSGHEKALTSSEHTRHLKVPGPCENCDGTCAGHPDSRTRSEVPSQGPGLMDLHHGADFRGATIRENPTPIRGGTKARVRRGSQRPGNIAEMMKGANP